MKLRIILGGLLAFMLASPAQAIPNPPPLNGHPVVDAANILNPAEEAALNQRLLDIAARSHHQLAVLTVPSLEGNSIADYSINAARFYGLGQRGADDGFLLTIAPAEHKMRIEVGTGAEALMTDAAASEIIADMRPFFRRNDYVGGINKGVDEIANIIVPLTPEQLAIQQRAAAEQQARSTAIWNGFLDVVGVIFGIIAAALGGFGLYRLATIPKRRREREAEEERLRVEAAARAEQNRLAAVARAERERQEEAERREQDRRDRAAEAAAERKRLAREKREREEREAMLAAMTPVAREAFLENERAEAERRRLAALAAEREAAKRREELEAEEAEAAATRAAARRRSEAAAAATAAAYDYSSSSSSSSSDSFSGGGGGFSGGGSDGGW